MVSVRKWLQTGSDVCTIRLRCTTPAHILCVSVIGHLESRQKLLSYFIVWWPGAQNRPIGEVEYIRLQIIVTSEGTLLSGKYQAHNKKTNIQQLETKYFMAGGHYQSLLKICKQNQKQTKTKNQKQKQRGTFLYNLLKSVQ